VFLRRCVFLVSVALTFFCLFVLENRSENKIQQPAAGVEIKIYKKKRIFYLNIETFQEVKLKTTIKL
jgi:hypothetical protein